EIDRLIHEAESFADRDRHTKEAVMVRNKLDSLLRNTKKSFLRFGGLLPEEMQENAERVFAEAAAAVRSENADEMNKVLRSLEFVAGQLTTAMLKPTADTTEV